MSKKIAFVTGCTGMDGSHISDLLLEKDYKVYGLIRRSSNPSNTNIQHLINEPHFEMVEGDITDATSVMRIISLLKPDECYNFCGQSQVGVSFNEPVHTFKVNAEGVINVLEAIRLTSPATKLYTANTSEMFGKNYTIHMSPGPKVDDKFTYIENKFQGMDTPFIAQSPYAASKLASHYMVGTYRRGYNLFACSGILFNHESERRSTQFLTRKVTGYLGGLFKSCYLGGMTRFPFETSHFDYHPKMANHPKLSLGNLEAYRDWGYAVDYVRAAYLMLQQEKADDYIVATGQAYSVRQFVKKAFALVGLDYQKFVVIDPKFYRPAEVDWLQGDSAKARAVLGWEPTITFDHLVERMVRHDIGL